MSKKYNLSFYVYYELMSKMYNLSFYVYAETSEIIFKEFEIFAMDIAFNQSAKKFAELELPMVLYARSFSKTLHDFFICRAR